MTRASHIPRVMGDDVGRKTMSTPRKCKGCSNERCIHQDQPRPPVGGKGTVDATRGAEA